MKEKLFNRFCKYTSITSTSNSDNADKGIMPSTFKQWDMAKAVLEDITNLGLSDCITTKYCYTYGRLPATAGFETKEGFALLAHIDTSEEVSGENVKVITKENPKDWLERAKEQNDEEMLKAIENGETILATDGTTLLGGDDKAGVSAIITALEFIIKNNIPHPQIEVIFSPDEETGHGMDHVPMELIKSKFAYTVDGGTIGELETECFNAAGASIKFIGFATHTGTAKNKMVNAIRMAADFISQIPQNELPETTCQREGFYAPLEIKGGIAEAQVDLLLRDFDSNKLEEKKENLKQWVHATCKKFGGSADIQITDQYKNMKEKLDENPMVVNRLYKAYELVNVEPKNSPIRGGTDGSRLTEMGIPTPNIFTGGHNFHSTSEWVSLEQMLKATEIIIQLIQIP